MKKMRLCLMFSVFVFLLFSYVCVTAWAATEVSIYEAAQQGRLDIIEPFLREGVNINAKNKSGRTILHYAAGGGHPGMVQFLLQKGADAKIVDNEGYNALDCALQRGHEGTAVVLRQAGAKPSRPVTTKAVKKPSSSKQTLNPSLRYPDLKSFEGKIGQSACLLKLEPAIDPTRGMDEV